MSARRRERARDRVAVGGPLDGLAVPRGRVRGASAWIDAEGRCHAQRGPGRWLYFATGRDGLAFWGHGARVCDGCGATLSPGNDGWPLDRCPLCGAEV